MHQSGEASDASNGKRESGADAEAVKGGHKRRGEREERGVLPALHIT